MTGVAEVAAGIPPESLRYGLGQYHYSGVKFPLFSADGWVHRWPPHSEEMPRSFQIRDPIPPRRPYLLYCLAENIISLIA